MTVPGATADKPPRRPLSLLVASTLCWLLAVLVFGSGLAVSIPAAAALPGGGLVLTLVAGVVGLALCYAGYGLRKAWRSAGWVALVACAIFVALQFIAARGRMGVVALINLTVMVLVLFGWRHLRAQRTNVGG